jgi:hypothetical protein
MNVATNDMTPEQLLSAAYLFGLLDAHDFGDGHVTLTAYAGNTKGYLDLMVERGCAERIDDDETGRAPC